MSVKSQKFEQPTIHQDLPTVEALHQVFDSLQQLDNVVRDVFGSIAGRIKTERDQITKICDRISAAQARVQQISANQTKATTVFSTAKYPAPETLPQFPRVFDNQQQPPVPAQRTAAVLKPTQRRAADQVNIFQLYTTLTGPSVPQTSQQAADSKEGLGRLPSYLPSISSILLFNSSENPYKTYVTLDNLEGIGGKDREQQRTTLAEAPVTIKEKSVLPAFNLPTFEYVPPTPSVPILDAPLNLPLPGVADVKFEDNENKLLSIAPSLSTLSSRTSGSDFPQLMSPTSKKPEPRPSSSTVTTSVPVPAPPQGPIPAPPTPMVPPVTTVAGRADIPVPPPVPGVPAPPPMTSVPGPVPPPDAPQSSAPGGRSDLLAAIRNPGNKNKLRKVTDEVVQENKKKAPAKKAEGGDLMSSLREMLAARRVATSGRSEKETMTRHSSVSEDDGKKDDEWNTES